MWLPAGVRRASEFTPPSGDPEYPSFSTLTAVTHSYGVQGTISGASSAGQNYISQLAAEVVTGAVTNYGKGSSLLTWVPTYTPLGGTDVSQNSAVWLVRHAAFQASASAPYNSRTGLHVVNIGLNDLDLIQASLPQTGLIVGGVFQVNAFKRDLRAMLSRMRCAWKAEESIITPTANWSIVSNGGDGSGTNGMRTTSAAAANLSIAYPSDFPGGTLVVGFMSVDNTATAGQGSVFDLSLDGGAPVSKSVTGTSNTGAGAARVRQDVHRFENVAAGAHTVTVDLTTLAGLGIVDWVGFEKTDAPIILVLGQPILPPDGLAFYGITSAHITAMRTATQQVCAEFTDGKVVYVDVSGIDGDESYFQDIGGADDDIHLLDNGHDYYTERCLAALEPFA